jgi:CBS domain-containing protein
MVQVYGWRTGLMGELDVRSDLDADELRRFMKALLTDLRALEEMINRGMIESGARRVGAEQELFLVDSVCRPAPVSVEVLGKLDDPHFTTELARFNLEFNLDPMDFGGDCLRRLEDELGQYVNRTREAAAEYGAQVVLAGILPTLHKTDLELDNMTPRERYRALNDAMRRMRGEDYEFRIAGTDELIIKHDSVMLEACNTSFQVHFQAGAEEYARLYNVAQVVAAPVLAAAVNSPLLFGRRLLTETRIALFQQAVDTRRTGHQLLERNARVSFGNRWVKNSVLEIFREDIARFRVLLGMDTTEDPFECLRNGTTPHLRALQLHNGTVYRWNRACYGNLNGSPQLRIENRILPSGPTILDEVANAAFWFGLMGGVSREFRDVTEVMDFDQAKANFLAAARYGLEAQFFWLDGRASPASDLILDRLLPLAREGLQACGIDSSDADRYLGIIEQRTSSRKTGARWLLQSLAELKGLGTKGEQMAALTAATIREQRKGRPVHEWPLADMDQIRRWHLKFMRVEQYMTTDLFTVHEDEVIDLVANLMDWENIRHVPVEDNQHRLVGLISYRSLLRLLGRDLVREGQPIAVNSIMHREPVTVGPETPTLEAIELMRKHRISCLPVVKDERLVGIVTERDFMNIAAMLLEQKLNE